MNLAKFPPHTFHARCCKCIFWENIASIPPSPLLWMTDVDVSAVGVFRLLSYSELRGLLVLVSFIHPRHHSHHTHHAGSWDFIHNHRILMIMSTLQHYHITTLHNSVNTLEECNRMPESNEPQIFISQENQFSPWCHSFCLISWQWLWQCSHVGHVACRGNWFPSLHSPAAGPSPNFF